MKKANIYYKNILAGVIEENDDGYLFQYDETYINPYSAKPILSRLKK